ncbi:OsmC family protein [Paracoccaceae bacterium GXU_MW_L88]
MIRKGNATWSGDLQSGKGTVSTQSGALSEQPFGFNTRFEDAAGTNPEELVGAAHAGCFSMAMSVGLGEAGYTADSIETEAKVHLEKDDSGFSVPKIELVTKAKIPDISDEEFQKIAAATKEGCPISKLMNAEVTLDASLV